MPCNLTRALLLGLALWMSAGRFSPLQAQSYVAKDSSFHYGLGRTASLANRFGADGTIYASLVLNDGKLLIAGNFTSVEGFRTLGIARLTSQGVIDTAFKILTPRASGQYRCLTQDADGNIWVGGDFAGAFGANRRALAKLSPNGQVLSDMSYNGVLSQVNCIRFSSLNQLWIGGIGRQRCAERLDNTGNPVPGFTAPALAVNPSDTNHPEIRDILIDSALTRIVLGGRFTQYGNTPSSGLVAIDGDGNVNQSFRPQSISGVVCRIKKLSSGKYLIGGHFYRTGPGTQGRNRIARLESNGLLDVSFAGWDEQEDDGIIDMTVLDDNTIIAAGTTLPDERAPSGGMYKINRFGTITSRLNSSNGSGGSPIIMTIAPMTGGRLFVGGRFGQYNAKARRRMAIIDTLGQLQSAYNPPIGPNGPITALANHPNGTTWLAGRFDTWNNRPVSGLLAIQNDGTLNTSFPRASTIGGQILTLAPSQDGKVWVGGDLTSYSGWLVNGLFRMQANGRIDSSLAPINNGYTMTVRKLTLGSDGKLYVSGMFLPAFPATGPTRYFLRLMPDGQLDASFTPFEGGEVRDFVLEADGKITLIGGAFVANGGTRRFGHIRLLYSGAVDALYLGTENLDSARVVQQGHRLNDGSLLLSGPRISLPSRQVGTGTGLVRFDAFGLIDASFQQRQTDSLFISCSAVLPDGRILVGGRFDGLTIGSRSGLAMLYADGGLNRNFRFGNGLWLPGGAPTAPDVLTGAQKLVVGPAPNTYWVAGLFIEAAGETMPFLTRISIGAPCQADIPTVFPRDSVMQLCAGQTASFTARVGTGQILWNDGTQGPSLTATAPGRYYAYSRSQSGCLSPQSPSVFLSFQAALPRPSLRQSGDTLFAGGWVAEPGLRFMWYRNDSLIRTSDSPFIFIPNRVADYRVSLSLGNCTSEPSTILRTVALAALQTPAVKVYPNPFQDHLSLEASQAAEWKLLDAMGRVIASGQVKATQQIISTQSLPSGSYLLWVQPLDTQQAPWQQLLLKRSH